MSERAEIIRSLDRLTEEVATLKKAVIKFKPTPSLTTRRAWRDLVKASKKAAKSWDKISAVEEIRNQREKKW